MNGRYLALRGAALIRLMGPDLVVITLSVARLFSAVGMPAVLVRVDDDIDDISSMDASSVPATSIKMKRRLQS